LRAPAIAGLPDWYVVSELTKFKANIRGAHPDDNEGHRMRPMARTLYHPGDVAAVAAYVSKLPMAKVQPTIKGDVAKGQAQYGTICIACQNVCEKFPNLAECTACGIASKACAEEYRTVAA
jgi:mono/diheme cytochrome c family protein